MSDNPFRAIADFYNSQVQKADEAGFADMMKECAEAFFRSVNDIKRWGNRLDSPVTFEDIEYLDGYFIFGTGTNTIVHFHIKECPGWLFAIWWDKPEEDESGIKRITGTFFTQFEESIDKFKPSRSEIQTTISIHLSRPEDMSVWSASGIIRFIMDEPYLAFCRDYLNWDYNYEYHTREEAEEEWNKFRAYQEGEAEVNRICDEKMLCFVREKILPMFESAELIELGDGWSPRYEVRAPFDLNTHMIDEGGEPGFYSWFDEETEEGRALKAEYKALNEECEEIADGFYWHITCHPDVLLYRKEEMIEVELP